MLNKEQRILAFVGLGRFLKRSVDQYLEKAESIPAFQSLLHEAYIHNGWFDEANVLRAFSGVIDLLEESKMRQLLVNVPNENPDPKTIALIMAGNIPMVGFHDMLMVLLSGNKLLAKLSIDDKVLPVFLLDALLQIEPSFKAYIAYAEGKLQNIDVVIATGSNNSARYFEYYFSKYPHIIRKNRQSVAIIKGDETETELKALAKDVFYYYGLGCRNVSQLLVPQNYDFSRFFENIYDFGNVIQNKKYCNNYEYNRAIYLLSSEKILDNNFLILKSDNAISSPVAVLYETEYDNIAHAYSFIDQNKNQIQCVVGKELEIKHVAFGESQLPQITDFADHVNTLDFLLNLQ
jgi:hypothetical protein